MLYSKFILNIINIPISITDTKLNYILNTPKTRRIYYLGYIIDYNFKLKFVDDLRPSARAR